MNKKAFTLIELLAVISILAIIAMIVFPAINSAIKTARESAYNDQITIIENAAKEWALDNIDELPDTNSGGETKVSVSTLASEGYISEEDILDPRNPDEELGGYVKITYESNGYVYKYEEDSSQDETAASWLLENASDKTTLKANSGIYKGSNAQNYLTFSGKTWRILSANSNGTIKAIMDTDVTTLPYDSNGQANFANSSVYTYLNNTFLNTLSTSKLTKGSYCTGSADDPCADTTVATVSLPSIEDYVNASNKQGCAADNNLCSQGTYLNLSNACLSNTDGNQVYIVDNGSITLTSPTTNCNIRPVITLDSDITLEGAGTSTNPFVVN